jgi:hypothetical protein
MRVFFIPFFSGEVGEGRKNARFSLTKSCFCTRQDYRPENLPHPLSKEGGERSVFLKNVLK